MERKRVTLTVTVELDPCPGAFSTPHSARNIVRGILEDRIYHYSPTVDLVDDENGNENKR